MKKFISLVVILSMILLTLPLVAPMTAAAMEDETPYRENQNWEWGTIRLHQAAYVRETGDQMTRAGWAIDAGGGSAIRDAYSQFYIGDYIDRHRSGEIVIQEVMMKINVTNRIATNAVGLYLLPPSFQTMFDTEDGNWDELLLAGNANGGRHSVNVTNPTTGTTMRNDATYLMSVFTVAEVAPLLTGDFWNLRNTLQSNGGGITYTMGLREFLERYPNERYITLKITRHMAVTGTGTASNRIGNPHTAGRTTWNMTGRTNAPGEAILRVGYKTRAIINVENAIESLEISTEDSANISRDVNLPTLMPNGVAISWQSSDESVINPATGAVNRPAFGENDKNVRLTATFSYEEHSRVETYDLTVLANRANPSQASYTTPANAGGGVTVTAGSTITANVTDIAGADSAWLRLVPINGRNASEANVSINVGGTTFSGQLDDSGSIYLGDIRPALGAGGNITVTIGLGVFHGANAAVTDDLRPAIIIPTAQNAVNEVADTITAAAIYPGRSDRVRTNLNLFTTSRYPNVNISWSSSPAGIISSSGALTRPDENTPVTLTATITGAGGVSVTRTVNVVAFGRNSDEAYFEEILNIIAFERMVVTNNFTVPVRLPDTQLTINWEASHPNVTRIGTLSGNIANVTVTRSGNSDINARMTAVIDNQGTRVTRDFFFNVLRPIANDHLANRTITDENAARTKRMAINDTVNTAWEIIGNDRTISIDAGRNVVLAEFNVVYDGTPVSGLVIQTSNDGIGWQTVHTTGVINPNVSNLIRLQNQAYNRFVRFTFPAGVTGVRFIGGYSTTAADGGPGQGIFASLQLPSEAISDFQLPMTIAGYPVTSWVSGAPTVIRIDGNWARVTRQTNDRTVTLTATVDVNGVAQTGSRQTHVPRLPQQPGGPGGPGAPSGPSGPSGPGFRPPNQVHIDNIHDITPQPPPPDPDWQAPEAFDDLDAVPWASEYIISLFEQGIVSGVAPYTFNPTGAMTREQMATIIVNAFDLERTNDDLPFNDAQLGSWYFGAVSAMYDHGISLGDGTGNFGVGLNISRQDAVVLLYRMLTNMGMIDEAGYAEAFADAANIADYAANSVSAFRALGIIGGDENGNFNPTAQITRAEMAIIIYRTLDLL
ncbi:MAG: S-layer homology domain-containing protein [Oscillospiraceae bacterium]|nr:S-layer homology domain-containing protein [Oscillospiraceae bacterium]